MGDPRDVYADWQRRHPGRAGADLDQLIEDVIAAARTDRDANRAARLSGEAEKPEAPPATAVAPSRRRGRR